MGTEIRIDELNRFLRAEMSAITSYQLALAKLDAHSPARERVLANLRSHQARVLMLRDAVIVAGGEPARGACAWGILGVAEPRRGPRLVDEPAALGALLAGEGRGLARYQADSGRLAAPARRLVITTLLPAQQTTHDRLSTTSRGRPRGARTKRARGHAVTRHGGGRARAPVRTGCGCRP